jgi:PhnB protein
MPDVNPIPEGYPRVTPYLYVDGAAEAIDFYVRILGATERMRMPTPAGTIGHAELTIGDSVVMLADEQPDMGICSPKRIGGSPGALYVYVDDVDAVFAKAIEAGATVIEEVKDQFYGDRSGQFLDPWGHRWSVGSHVEDVSPEELDRRVAQLFGGD